MSHELEIVDGKASFAYRKQGGAPWHKLGVAVDGHQTAPQMLELAKSGFSTDKLVDTIKSNFPKQSNEIISILNIRNKPDIKK